MRIGRYSKDGRIFWGSLEGDTVSELELVTQNPIQFQQTKQKHLFQDLETLSPLNPTQMIGIGDNFPRHPQDQKPPVIFNKSISSLALTPSNVKLPKNSTTWPEPEVGIVIGCEIKANEKIDLKTAILGYVLLNDVTCLTPENPVDTHASEAKNLPGFCTHGTFIETDFKFDQTSVDGFINGVTYRSGKMQNAKWDRQRIITEIVKVHSLFPFDIIMCGCPPRVTQEKTFLRAGDVFTAQVNGLGELKAQFNES